MMIDSEEKLEFDIGDGEQEATVTISEDTQGKTTSVVQNGPNSEELDQYSDKVKKRIDKLTARLRETERREQSALEYAKSVQTRNEELQKQYEQTAVARVGEAKGRVETQITALKNVIRHAREEGDIDTETEASQRLTTTLMEQRQLLDQEAQVRRIQQQVPQSAQQQTPVQQPPRRADVRAEEWAVHRGGRPPAVLSKSVAATGLVMALIVRCKCCAQTIRACCPTHLRYCLNRCLGVTPQRLLRHLALSRLVTPPPA